MNEVIKATKGKTERMVQAEEKSGKKIEDKNITGRGKVEIELKIKLMKETEKKCRRNWEKLKRESRGKTLHRSEQKLGNSLQITYAFIIVKSY